MVPTRAGGLLEPGQSVVLRLDAFPYQRFGVQHARIVQVAGSVVLPGDTDSPVGLSEPVYRVRARLATQSVDGYGQRWPLRTDLTFDADVVFERAPLIARLLDPLRAVVRGDR